MKRLLKLLLYPCVLLAGIYAATPLLLPFIITSQLPSGWQLENLEAGYPGTSGINIHVLSLKGEVEAARLVLTAEDIRFSYQGLKTAIGSTSIDVFVQSAGSGSADTPTLENLSLPVTKLTGKMPELSVGQLRMVLHHDMDIMVSDPLILVLQSLKLTPRTDSSYYLSSNVGLEGSPDVNGRLEVDVTMNSLKAGIHFPADSGSPPWLYISLEQEGKGPKTTTNIQATFDAEHAKQEWIDRILAQNTGGMLTHVGGQLEARAGFVGKDQQQLESLTLSTDQLQAEIDGGTLILEGELLASREGEIISITLPGRTVIQLQDRTGKFDELIARIIPELKRTPQPDVIVVAEIETVSRLVIQPGVDSSVEFSGDFNLAINSTKSGGLLHATDLQINSADFSNLDSFVANGLISFNWIEDAPFTYSLSDELPAPMLMTADEMDILAKVTLRDGDLFSTGDGIFIGGYIKPLATSASRVDISWQDLDLLKLAGKLSTKTQGFATEYEGETFSGFDFDITYDLLNNADIRGSGTLNFDSGPVFPIEFTGNTEAEKWNITLPPTSIELAQLSSLLQVAHFELPESIKLTNGYIEMQGTVTVEDEITAQMAINGYEVGASMLESSAHEVSFNFDTRFGDTISANGPVLVETISLAGGIDITGIRAKLNLENTEMFGLQNLYAELFGGQLKLDNIQFSGNRIEDTTIELSHINLGNLLAYADVDGLEGTGFLEIILPVGSDQTGIYIQDGSFKATEPGYLAYTKEGVAGSNIGLQALENFQYQDLSGTLNYQADGSYQIAVHLEGQNPDLYGGHPILFNLNISGSLPELFESLFITGDFEESILNQIRTN